jgi:hypothetical protein
VLVPDYHHSPIFSSFQIPTFEVISGERIKTIKRRARATWADVTHLSPVGISLVKFHSKLIASNINSSYDMDEILPYETPSIST